MERFSRKEQNKEIDTQSVQRKYSQGLGPPRSPWGPLFLPFKETCARFGKHLLLMHHQRPVNHRGTGLRHSKH